MKKLFFLASFAFGFYGNAQSFQMVKDVNPATNNVNGTNTAFKEVNGKVYYCFDNGTAVGTVNLTTSIGGFAGGNGAYNYDIFAASFGVFVIYVKLGTTGSELCFYSNGNMGVSELSKTKIQLYPNPVKDILYFSEEISNIRITDISGRTVKEISNSSKLVKSSKSYKRYLHHFSNYKSG